MATLLSGRPGHQRGAQPIRVGRGAQQGAHRGVAQPARQRSQRLQVVAGGVGGRQQQHEQVHPRAIGRAELDAARSGAAGPVDPNRN